MNRYLHRGLAGLIVSATLILAAPGPERARAEQPVALELLLAIDVSTSVDEDEFELQMAGTAEAFRHPAVLGAIDAAGPRGIAVSMMQWSDRRSHVMAVGWTLIDSPAAALAFADALDRTPRHIGGGGTSLKAAIDAAAAQFANNGFVGERQVIDIAADGGFVTFIGDRPDRARNRALVRGITINGLAIIDLEPFLKEYFIDYVIGGPGAFVLIAEGYDDFARAILNKLVREIGEPQLAAK